MYIMFYDGIVFFKNVKSYVRGSGLVAAYFTLAMAIDEEGNRQPSH